VNRSSEHPPGIHTASATASSSEKPASPAGAARGRQLRRRPHCRLGGTTTGTRTRLTLIRPPGTLPLGRRRACRMPSALASERWFHPGGEHRVGLRATQPRSGRCWHGLTPWCLGLVDPCTANERP
jgi:hypothetical protein